MLNISQEITEITNVIEEKLVVIRRRLHQYPELSLKEYETSKFIAEELKKIPHIEVITNLGQGTGVLGILQGENPNGECIILRADIDALPINEETNLAYASTTPNVMHACGHDAHTTWMLGAAMILSQLRDKFNGTIKFVFQPAEEIGAGAKDLIKDNILDNPPVSAAFSAHVWPYLDSGLINIASKYAFCAVGSFKIKVIGKGGHGAWPQDCVDPIAIANLIYTNLQQIVSRKIDSTTPRVLTVGSIHAGEVGNIIPDECIMRGTLRALEADTIEQMITHIKQISTSIAEANGGKAEVRATCGLNSVANDHELIQLCLQAGEQIVGKNIAVTHDIVLGGEDFSEFSSRVPSVYMYIGINQNEFIGLHSSKLQVDERVLKTAASVFSNIAITYLNNGN